MRALRRERHGSAAVAAAIEDDLGISQRARENCASLQVSRAREQIPVLRARWSHGARSDIRMGRVGPILSHRHALRLRDHRPKKYPTRIVTSPTPSAIHFVVDVSAPSSGLSNMFAEKCMLSNRPLVIRAVQRGGPTQRQIELGPGGELEMRVRASARCRHRAVFIEPGRRIGLDRERHVVDDAPRADEHLLVVGLRLPDAVNDLVVDRRKGDVGVQLFHQGVGVTLVDGRDRAVPQRPQLIVQGFGRRRRPDRLLGWACVATMASAPPSSNIGPSRFMRGLSIASSISLGSRQR